MKPIKNLQFIILSIIIVTISSCSATNDLTINVTNPAPVYLPANLKQIGVLDRSLTTAENKTLDDVDKVLSIEGKTLDKEGAKAVMQGLSNQLRKNKSRDKIILIENSDLRTTGLGVFPAALSWDVVEQLCTKNKIDALFVVSFYDTETKVSFSTSNSTKVNALGIRIPLIQQVASINTLIKVGFRIYDPVNKVIRDEYVTNQTVHTEGRGINPIKAVNAALNRKQRVLQLSDRMGEKYALQILPYQTKVHREYYVRGSNNFKVGKRKAQTGNWDGAAELWENEIDNAKMKIAGRAYYNMAIYNEIEGKLDTAMDWASKSYSDYKNKKALHYLNILKDRKATNNQLREETQ